MLWVLLIQGQNPVKEYQGFLQINWSFFLAETLLFYWPMTRCVSLKRSLSFPNMFAQIKNAQVVLPLTLPKSWKAVSFSKFKVAYEEMNSFILWNGTDLPGKQLEPEGHGATSWYPSLQFVLLAQRDSFQMKRLHGRRALAVSNVGVPLVYSREMHIQIDNANAVFVLPANEFLSVK